MSFVIAHAQLLLDQVRHARAGPQRGFIAQPFRTSEQQGPQALPVFLVQTRLAPRPPGFPERRLAPATILLHPAGYSLTNHLDLAGNGGLILSSFEPSFAKNGLAAT